MKIKSTYQLREVAGEFMVVSTGDDENAFNGVIMLNGTGAFLWKLLENGAEFIADTPEEIFEIAKSIK